MDESPRASCVKDVVNRRLDVECVVTWDGVLEKNGACTPLEAVTQVV